MSGTRNLREWNELGMLVLSQRAWLVAEQDQIDVAAQLHSRCRADLGQGRLAEVDRILSMM